MSYCKLLTEKSKITLMSEESDFVEVDFYNKFKREGQKSINLGDEIKDIFSNYINFLEFSEDYKLNVLCFSNTPNLFVFGDKKGGIVLDHSSCTIIANQLTTLPLSNGYTKRIKEILNNLGYELEDNWQKFELTLSSGVFTKAAEQIREFSLNEINNVSSKDVDMIFINN